MRLVSTDINMTPLVPIRLQAHLWEPLPPGSGDHVEGAGEDWDHQLEPMRKFNGCKPGRLEITQRVGHS